MVGPSGASRWVAFLAIGGLPLSQVYGASKHLRDTLAWLACQTDVHINGECVATQHGIYNYEAGSGKGLAEAIVDAARRGAPR